MTHIEKVKNLESELISTIKTSYDNLKLSDGDAIEFTNPFHIYITQDDYAGPIKFPIVISGMMDNYILVGVSDGSEVEISVDILESVYELAYIADNIKSGEFSILVN